MTPDLRTYELRVGAHLDERWTAWFGDVTIERDDDGTCTLTGPVVDQAQLHGILARLRDIGVPLVSVRTVDGHERGDGARSAPPSAHPGSPTP